MKSEEPDNLDNIMVDMLTKIRKAHGKECLQEVEESYYNWANKHIFVITLWPSHNFGHDQWGLPFPSGYKFPPVQVHTRWVHPTSSPVKGWGG